MTYLQPVLPVALLLIALALLRYQSPRWRRVGIVALLGLFLCSMSPVAAFFNYTLEWPYPFATPPAQEVGAIVVLSGGVSPPDALLREPVPAANTYVRCRYAAWLYRNWRAAPVYAAGGSDEHGTVLADAMRRVLEAEGVPRDVIFTENRSTSTYTNAVNTVAMLKARGIRKVVVVTEGFHMWRSELCFRKQGMDVLAAPCAFRGVGFAMELSDWIPAPKALAWTGDALHEWLGMVWYRISGKI